MAQYNKKIPDDIIDVLEQNNWNVNSVSKIIQVTPSAIFKALKDLNYGITFLDTYKAAAAKLFLLIHNPDVKVSLKAIEMAAKFASVGIQVETLVSNSQNINTENIIKDSEINIG